MYTRSLASKLAVTVLAFLAFSSHALSADDPTISVTGEAEVKVMPDIGKLAFGIESRAKTLAAASEEVDKKVKAVLEYLKSAGVEDKHIHTEMITIEPIFRDRYVPSGKGQAAQQEDPFGDPTVQAPPQNQYAPIQPAGYKTSRELVVTIVDLKKFETIYKGLVERGVNRILGLEFTSSELKNLQNKARLDAVRNARDKAQAMAGQLGAKLATIKTMREGRNQSGMPHIRSSGAMGGLMGAGISDDPFGAPSSESPVHAGELVVTSTVDIVFGLSGTEF